MVVTVIGLFVFLRGRRHHRGGARLDRLLRDGLRGDADRVQVGIRASRGAGSCPRRGASACAGEEPERPGDAGSVAAAAGTDSAVAREESQRPAPTASSAAPASASTPAGAPVLGSWLAAETGLHAGRDGRRLSPAGPAARRSSSCARQRIGVLLRHAALSPSGSAGPRLVSVWSGSVSLGRVHRGRPGPRPACGTGRPPRRPRSRSSRPAQPARTPPAPGAERRPASSSMPIDGKQRRPWFASANLLAGFPGRRRRLAGCAGRPRDDTMARCEGPRQSMGRRGAQAGRRASRARDQPAPAARPAARAAARRAGGRAGDRRRAPTGACTRRSCATHGYGGRIVSFEPSDRRLSRARAPRGGRRCAGRCGGWPSRTALRASSSAPPTTSAPRSRSASSSPRSSRKRSRRRWSACRRLASTRWTSMLPASRADAAQARRPGLRAAGARGRRRACCAQVGIVETELSVVPLYEGQPLLTDMLRALAEAGFALVGTRADPARLAHRRAPAVRRGVRQGLAGRSCATAR